MSRDHSSMPGYVELKDGPGHGKKFHVQRAPVFLRVVEDLNGTWDVLDLLEDEPTDSEEIHVYRQLSWMHVRANDRRHNGVYYTYVHVPISGELKGSLRYSARWQDWATLARVAS